MFKIFGNRELRQASVEWHRNFTSGLLLDEDEPTIIIDVLGAETNRVRDPPTCPVLQFESHAFFGSILPT
ncbi:hypothetical protein [Palleronia abyssalis]|uniref:Uncharacterized protein n=1 Tax=Palleronia abyssalis TaxID=1501240 RepID=A0A2R8BXG4_9RHOB|nr:hypothetical protein [Palleronia abyssalis]SPJ24845.1 hypothetical protein PAA8504_02686 [Palleronia abyssalis]